MARTVDNTLTYQGKRPDRSVEAVQQLSAVETQHPWLKGLVTTKTAEARAEVLLSRFPMKNSLSRIL